MARRKLTTREYLERQREADREYHGHLWWVHLTEPTLLKNVACAKGDELCAVWMALMDMRDAGVLAEYSYKPTKDPDMALFDLGAGVETLVLHDSRARTVLDCLKKNGCHGTCRKAGTKEVFKF